MTDLIKDLLSYYNRQPDNLMIRKAGTLLFPLTDQKKQEVADWLINHVPKKAGLDVLTLKNAMVEVGCPPVREQEESIKWVCDLCGTHFDSVVVSTPEQRKNNIHDYCPKCGLAPQDTITARMYANRETGDLPKWYEQLKMSKRENFLAPGKAPRYDYKGDMEYEKKLKQRELQSMRDSAKDEVQKLLKAKIHVSSKPEEQQKNKQEGNPQEPTPLAPYNPSAIPF